MDCLFCKIIAGEIPAKLIYEDNDVVAFDDIHPQAPHHKLIVPRQHIATVNDLDENSAGLVGKMVHTAKKLAEKLNIAEQGYRLILNCNADGGQMVFHIHLHLLGGKALRSGLG